MQHPEPLFNIVAFANQILANHAEASLAGPLRSGHYIQISLGMGFYVPEADYEAAQLRANTLGQVQFLGVTRVGGTLTGTREDILSHPDSAGLVAWILPQ